MNGWVNRWHLGWWVGGPEGGFLGSSVKRRVGLGGFVGGIGFWVGFVRLIGLVGGLFVIGGLVERGWSVWE